ncbi:MAG: helix-turn-helix transcriptional regulator [Anaerolineae bacterium]|nr:helix-turn-helix transcriptional regulator [Anaerolineae bacterium]
MFQEVELTMLKVDITKQLERKFGTDKRNWPSIDTMAKAVGVHRFTASAWLKGRIESVELDMLAKWCDYLGCEPGDIIIRD